MRERERERKGSFNKWHIDATNDNDNVNDNGDFDGGALLLILMRDFQSMYSLWLN